MISSKPILRTSFIVLLPLFLFCQTHEIGPQEAAQHLQKKVEPVYSPTAKQLRLQGDVVLRIAISETGTVTLLGVKSGSPLLSTSAIEAIKQWQYSPFLLEGKPVAVQTLVTIPFSLGDSPERIKQLEEINNRYFETIDLCRKQEGDGQLDRAESTCKKAISLSEQLDPAHRLERLGAWRETGHVFFLQRKFVQALEHYRKELALGEEFLTANNAELAAAQYHVGNGLWGTGRPDEAALQYAKAENGYKQAAAHIDSAFLKNEYAKHLKRVLSDHAAMLRQMNRSSEADALDKQASAIVVREGLRDD